LIIQDNVSAPILPNRIPDVLKESEKLKAGQKWTVIVTPKAEGIKDYPARLEFRIGPASPIGLSWIKWNGDFCVIW